MKLTNQIQPTDRPKRLNKMEYYKGNNKVCADAGKQKGSSQ